MVDVEKKALVWDGESFYYFKEIKDSVIYVCGSPEQVDREDGPYRAFGLNGNPFWVIPPDRHDEVMSAVAELNAAKAKLEGLKAQFVKL